MITKEVINSIYKQYPHRAKIVDCLDIPMLFDSVGKLHNITVDIDSERLIIGSLNPKSVFHSILLKHIHAFLPFENWTAIVLPTSIIFLNKKNRQVSIHIKPHKESLGDRIKNWLKK